MTGESQGPRGPDYLTVAYNTLSGKAIWKSRYNGPGDSGDVANALAVSNDGGAVFVTGQSIGSDADKDYATIAYDASNGSELWIARYDSSLLDFATSIAISPDGARLFVTGQSGSAGDYTTIAYETSSGVELWVGLYKGPGGSGDVANSITVAPDGALVFVTGESSGTDGEYDYATVAYDSVTGSEAWVSRYDGPAHSRDVAESIGSSSDGSAIVVTGWSYATNVYADYATVAYDASTGGQLWVRRYNGPADTDDEAHSLAISPDGTSVFVTGQSAGSGGDWDYATIAYRISTGAKLWLRRYDGPGGSFDQASSLAVSSDSGTVFVTGLSVGNGTGEDYATLSYTASTGAREWLRRFNGPADEDDVAHSLAVDSFGARVYVTGESHSPLTDWDYVSIAYGARSSHPAPDG